MDKEGVEASEAENCPSSPPLNLSPSPFFPSVGSASKIVPPDAPAIMAAAHALPKGMEAMLEQATWGNAEIERARGIFQLHTEPNEPYLTEEQFTNIMLTLGVSEGYCHRYFMSFDLDGNERVEWPEFVMGFAAMDPGTQHDGAWNVERGKYIFRVYDLDGDGRITTTDFLHMIRHIRRGQGLSTDPQEVHEHARAIARALGRKKKPYIDEVDFMEAVAKMRFPGTTVLFRLSRSPVRCEGAVVAKEAFLRGSGTGQQKRVKIAMSAHVPVGRLSLGKEGLGGGGKVDVEMGDGHETKAGPRDALDGSRDVFFEIPKEAMAKVDFLSPKLALAVDREAKDPSLTDVAKSVISAVMGYDKLERDLTSTSDVGSFTLIDTASIEMLCRGVYNVVAEEQCCVEVEAPVRIFGDLHGQLREAVEFFHTFGAPDHLQGDINLVNFIFNGDFVDRGVRCLELVCFLFAIKVLYPRRVFLVRGNHEDRQINYANGFYQECVKRLACQEDGEKIWEVVNRVFDWLPIAARVSSVILVLHGGIGASLNTVDQILAFQRPITSDHIANSALLQDILWSDPTNHDSEVGVQKNPPRGNGIVRFGADRVYEFCERSGIQLVVRSHQCVARGFELFARGHLITVFSATNYTGKRMNDGAILEVSAKLQVTARTIAAKPLSSLR